MYALDAQPLQLREQVEHVATRFVELPHGPDVRKWGTAGYPQPNILVGCAKTNHELILVLGKGFSKDAAYQITVESVGDFAQDEIVNVHGDLAVCSIAETPQKYDICPVSKKKILPEQAQDASPRTLILAIETATDVSSVALFDAGRLIALRENHASRTHARLATVLIEGMLSDLELKMVDLSAVVVAKGPGSYTGLRVGVSVAKGLCMALDIPLLSVGSLEALAWSVGDFAKALDAHICAMIDARRMEVFAQCFDSQLSALGNPQAEIIEAGAYAEALSTQRMLFVGDGAEKCRGILEAHPNAIVLGNRLSSAAFLGTLAHRQLELGLVEDLMTFEPFYLKEFVATLSTKKVL
jgi:tRNA threonylcarbamoyladenosine biosynthesis protein TsaB